MGGTTYGETDMRVEKLLESHRAGPLGLVRLVTVKDREAFPGWLATTAAAVDELGGRRIYAGQLDVVPERAERAYDALVIDELPSRATTLALLSRPCPEEEKALRDQHVMVATPAPQRLRRRLGWLARALRLLAPLRAREAPPLQMGEEEGDVGGDARMLEVFHAADQWQSLVMLNLNAYRKRAAYREQVSQPRDVSGREAYRRYGSNALPRIFRRGGRVQWMAGDVETLAGAPDNRLSQPWHELVLVFYPSRTAFRHMLVDPGYRKGLPHRVAGIERAMLVPGVPDAEYDLGR